jgi:hypothetical protein
MKSKSHPCKEAAFTLFSKEENMTSTDELLHTELLQSTHLIGC